MSMELTIQPMNLSSVVFNKQEMAAAIAAINERYTGLVVTDKAEAKRDRAEVNRILKQIDDARKAVKKQYEAPLKAFEADIKELVEPLKASGEAIDAQIKAIEEQERKERREALEAVYADLDACVPLSRVWDDKWTNTSTSTNKAAESLTDAVRAAEADIASIRGLNSVNEAALIQRYLGGATLADVLAYDAELKQTAQTFTISGTETPEDIVTELEQENPRNEYTVTDTGIQVTGKTEMHTITVSCTDGQLAQIAGYMERMGVFFIME